MDPSNAPDNAPGAERLFDELHIYRDFEEWAEIFWGIDWIDVLIDEEKFDIALGWYEFWLEEHILVMSELDRFQDYLAEIGLSLDELLSALSDTFRKGDALLDTLLDSLSKWFFKQFGLSP